MKWLFGDRLLLGACDPHTGIRAPALSQDASS
jgi:hypothetical protein